MNAPALKMTETVPIIDTPWYRFRCAVRLHAYGRWQLATLIYTNKTQRNVRVRECTTCGWLQIRPL